MTSATAFPYSHLAPLLATSARTRLGVESVAQASSVDLDDRRPPGGAIGEVAELRRLPMPSRQDVAAIFRTPVERVLKALRELFADTPVAGSSR